MSAPRYQRPLSPDVAHWADALDANAREWFEERAAIYEFEAGMSRGDAEAASKSATERFLASGNPFPSPVEKAP